MDPHAVLGVSPDAPPDVLAAAYRRAAKRWHPDRAGGRAAAARMAEINAAYDLLRDGGWRSAQAAAATAAASTRPPRRRARGEWLSEELRGAMGGELVAALRDGEAVRLVTPASTWASPTTVLAVTEHRLLWLQDDAIAHRVQSVTFAAIAEARLSRHRFRRHVAALRLRTVHGRRHTFAELRPQTAEAILGRIPAERRVV